MFSIKEVVPQVFHVEFESTTKMCEVFMRCQETYESSNKRFRNQRFTIDEYKNWYAKTFNSQYENDWGGFNIPSYVLDFVFGQEILDPNVNDKHMKYIYSVAKALHYKFYVIASSKQHNNSSFNHELAHAFYYLDEDYKKAMNKLVVKIPLNTKRRIYNKLQSVGYTYKVFKDETQAYLSTGYESILDINYDTSKFQQTFLDRVNNKK